MFNKETQNRQCPEMLTRLLNSVVMVLIVVIVLSIATMRAMTQSLSKEETVVSVIPFTEEQAARGRVLFRKNCMFCHSSNEGDRQTPEQHLRGFLVGADSTPMAFSVGGRYPLKYPTVYHLFARIRGSMPAWDIESVSHSQKLDIVAYLLSEAGLSSGPKELLLDVEAMKMMRLRDSTVSSEEPGFKPIFNGNDFSGIKFLFGTNCRPAPDGCGKTEPTSFRVENGTIVGEGREHGYLYTENQYLNFNLRYDYRWVPPADHDLGDSYFSTASAGTLLFITEAENQIWPRCMEIEGDNSNIMRAIGMGAQIKTEHDEVAAIAVNKGPGPWNSVEIVSQNGEVIVYLNGVKVTHVTEHPFVKPGYIAFQYQGGKIAYRNIRIKDG